MSLEQRVKEMSEALMAFCKTEMEKVTDEHGVVVLHLASINLIATNILVLCDFTPLTYEQVRDDFIRSLDDTCKFIKEKANEH